MINDFTHVANSLTTAMNQAEPTMNTDTLARHKLPQDGWLIAFGDHLHEMDLID